MEINLDKFEIISKTFKREPTKRVPFALWKHFPEYDKTPNGLFKAQMEFQKKYDSDIMKIAIHGRTFVVDFGAELGGYHPDSGSRICTRQPIQEINDWETIEAVDPNSGEIGKQIKAMELIGGETEGKIPTMMTVFSPFMIASQMDSDIIEHHNQNPNLIKGQIKMLTSLLIEFVKGAIDAGANGIFLATQHFNNRLEMQTRRELEFNPMESLIKDGLKEDNFCVIHLHGDNPDFELATKLPHVTAINWHDQQTSPNLFEASKIFSGALLGGLNTEVWPQISKISEIGEKIKFVYNNFNEKGLILSPGCVIPQQAGEEQLSLAVKTIKNLKPN